MLDSDGLQRTVIARNRVVDVANQLNVVGRPHFHRMQRIDLVPSALIDQIDVKSRPSFWRWLHRFHDGETFGARDLEPFERSPKRLMVISDSCWTRRCDVEQRTCCSCSRREVASVGLAVCHTVVVHRTIGCEGTRRSAGATYWCAFASWQSFRLAPTWAAAKTAKHPLSRQTRLAAVLLMRPTGKMEPPTILVNPWTALQGLASA